MASRLIRVLCASILAISVGSACAADKGDIRLKKKTDGAVELSNLAEEDEGEVLVENKVKSDSQAPNAMPNDTPAPAVARGEDRIEAVGQGETRAPRERQRFGAEETVNGSSSHQGGANPYASSGASAVDSGAMTGGSNLPQSALPGSSSNAPSILPNPRPGTDQAVLSTVDTSSTGNQERYATKMVQEGAAASASGSLSVVDNPASVRRYLATDRAAYQKRMGY
jgi:hypothetical protein